jgi:hypothetical protein
VNDEPVIASRATTSRRWRDDISLLRRRDLGLVLVSRLVSDFGTGIAPIALAFGVLALPGGDASGLGLVLLCAALPRLVSCCSVAWLPTECAVARR